MRNATHTLSALFLALASLGLAACSSSSTKEQPTPGSDAGPGSDASAGPTIDKSNVKRDQANASDIPTAVDANNAFAIDLYGKVSATAHGGNFLTSPLSATLALTMTYAGARGKTASQMATVLHIPSSGTSIFDAQNALTQALDGRAADALRYEQQQAKMGNTSPPSSDDCVLDVVNSIWGQHGYPWESSFLSRLAKSYGAGVYVENFETNPTGAENDINKWVSDETAGKIDPLLPPGAIDGSTRMVLVNAIHVKLPWDNPFDATQTKSGTFTRGDSSAVQADFMNQTFSADGTNGTIGYQETSAGQFLSLPLANNDLSVVFALPKKDLATLTTSLTKDSFTVPQTGDIVVLSLPKANLTGLSTFSLAAALQSLGMTDAFDQNTANFQGMCANPPDGNLYIGDVLQKAMIDVAEQGVEAAAATAVIMRAGASPVSPPTITLTFDHPYLVSIVDSSGAIMFLGQINDPTSSGS